MDYPYKLEILLRQALNSEMRSDYYGIDADCAHDSEGVWDMTRATLTAVQFAHPEKKDDIFNLLEGYHDLKDDNKNMSEWDMDYMESFYQELRKIIQG